jgi:hypothetical protein
MELTVLIYIIIILSGMVLVGQETILQVEVMLMPLIGMVQEEIIITTEQYI